MRRPHTAAPNKEPSARDSAEKALPRKNKGVHMPRFRLFRDDLDFILEQIKIAEENAAGVPLLSLVPNWDFQFGLRTLSGVNNNLLPFSAQFGAADNVFPRLATPPIFRTAEIQPANFFGPGSPAGTTPTSYNQTSGFVFDSQPRTISNLIVDQTAANPAAYAAAFDPRPA